MKKFEYFIFQPKPNSWTNESLKDDLNHYGKKGWELIESKIYPNCDEIIFIFKREII